MSFTPPSLSRFNHFPKYFSPCFRIFDLQGHERELGELHTRERITTELEQKDLLSGVMHSGAVLASPLFS